MKKISIISCLCLLTLIVGYTSCKKEDDDNKNECYTCTDCKGQYAHLLNGEKCASGFDNKEDWETYKKAMIEQNGCKCE